MDSEKFGNSNTSSEENGGQSSTSPDKSKDHDKAGSRWSYECTFCKRGFTNAQALGGHMNIHRKDKAKAKAEKNSTKSKKNDNLPHGIPNYSSHFTTPINSSIDLQGDYHHHSSSYGDQMNYEAYFLPPNPSYQQGYKCYYSNHSGGYEENLGANLSLRVGAPSAVENRKGLERDEKEDWLDQQVDLELRLGHHRSTLYSIDLN